MSLCGMSRGKGPLRSIVKNETRFAGCRNGALLRRGKKKIERVGHTGKVKETLVEGIKIGNLPKVTKCIDKLIW